MIRLCIEIGNLRGVPYSTHAFSQSLNPLIPGQQFVLVVSKCTAQAIPATSAMAAKGVSTAITVLRVLCFRMAT